MNLNKKFEIRSLLSDGESILKKVLESASFRLQQNVAKILGSMFKSMHNGSLWALKLGKNFYQLCVYF
jgi:hypothetical protein